MIKFKQQQKSRKLQAEVNLTPMIDIIFNLLIFFLIVAVVSQKGINLELPETETAEKRPQKSIEIMVSADKRIVIQGEVIAPEKLEAKLNAIKHNAGPEQNLILKADAKSEFGLFVTVMDSARKVGLRNLVIATEQKPLDLE
ncbi:MAG: biopolymer transporter ExbD [Bradymonadales bacterium]|jgi:biopolymer transport protein ExbD